MHESAWYASHDGNDDKSDAMKRLSFKRLPSETKSVSHLLSYAANEWIQIVSFL